MALIRTIDAATEPVTTAEAKAHCRVIGSADDTLIDAYIKAARQMAENELCRSLVTQTWELTLDVFPDEIELPYPPIIAVSSIQYLEAAAGALTVLSSAAYVVDKKSGPGWIVPAYNYAWPDTYQTINAVTVTYTAGYGTTADSVPQAIKNWILLHVGHLYENREASVQANMPGLSATKLPYVDGLLDPYRVATF